MTPHDGMDEQLRDALRREEAPPGFAERVLAAAWQQQAMRPSVAYWPAWIRRHIVPVYATALVLIVAVVMGAWEYRRYEQERREGEAARQQVLLALRIASRKLQYAQTKVNAAGRQGNTAQGNEER